MPERAKLVSALWDPAGNDNKTQLVAQAMVWKIASGIKTSRILDRMTVKNINYT